MTVRHDLMRNDPRFGMLQRASQVGGGFRDRFDSRRGGGGMGGGMGIQGGAN